MSIKNVEVEVLVPRKTVARVYTCDCCPATCSVPSGDITGWYIVSGPATSPDIFPQGRVLCGPCAAKGKGIEFLFVPKTP